MFLNDLTMVTCENDDCLVEHEETVRCAFNSVLICTTFYHVLTTILSSVGFKLKKRKMNYDIYYQIDFNLSCTILNLFPYYVRRVFSVKTCCVHVTYYPCLSIYTFPNSTSREFF